LRNGSSTVIGQWLRPWYFFIAVSLTGTYQSIDHCAVVGPQFKLLQGGALLAKVRMSREWDGLAVLSPTALGSGFEGHEEHEQYPERQPL
jgi:hypothetical protein